MFGRRRKKSGRSDAADTAEAVQALERHSPVKEPTKPDDRFRAQGPWDVSEKFPEVQRVDLGALRVPVGPDIEVQVNVAKQHNKVIGVTIVNGKTALQIQPFAAPKSSGLWEEVRDEIRQEIAQTGGRVEDFEGTFGPELRAVVPVPGKKNEQGHQLGQPARFIGVDGPRWFLRGVIRGEGAVRPDVAARIEEIFAGIVVVRGDMPVPPRELLELALPPQAKQRAAQPQTAPPQGAPAPTVDAGPAQARPETPAEAGGGRHAAPGQQGGRHAAAQDGERDEDGPAQRS
ncbi:DUF3710 domain-containing protein [Marinactinospora thermotolerans]|uniref:DUF3710 domain-containing protein n=1 Tax=Marinactinospora thermotolerans DSM 45154 TaxID=1122192 RepID=A0A1T4S6T1_9ACTN|nr:DUF3710 domain-containing protein [Marinactinospora thermotolerans]SKA23561.1 Protein of unknown function [Marinactinospora thermotolerans DSM 45154]